MPRRVFKRQSTSQESLAWIHQHEGYSNQEHLTDNVTENAAKKRKKTCDTSEKKKRFHKTKRRKIRKGYKTKRSKIKKGYNNVKVAPSEYVFYSVINTKYAMDQGTAAAAIARGLIELHNKLDSSNVLGYYIDKWTDSGQNIIILEGFDHKHLKYLHNEAQHAALDTHVLYTQWSSGQHILVLTVFGQQEDLEEIFEGLLPLR